MVVDARGQPIRFILTGGQAGDVSQAIPMLTGVEATHLIADKGYDNKLKHWSRIATRYDRRSLYFLAALHLAAAVIWSM